MDGNKIRIERRFRGPPRSANGGYVCALLASWVKGPAVVRLLAPPPLETDLRVEAADGVARLFHETVVVAEARTEAWNLVVPPPPPFASARGAARSYLGFTEHAFPGCFVCGPHRAEGDGLRVFPGVVPGTEVVAAPWVPAGDLADPVGRVAAPFLWAALDCTGGFAVLPAPPGRAVLLGEFSVQVRGAVAPGSECVLVGWKLGGEGRKRFAGSALFGEGGEIAAVARATWVEVPTAPYGDG